LSKNREHVIHGGNQHIHGGDQHQEMSYCDCSHRPVPSMPLFFDPQASRDCPRRLQILRGRRHSSWNKTSASDIRDPCREAGGSSAVPTAFRIHCGRRPLSMRNDSGCLR
jgi:hypothetical protein